MNTIKFNCPNCSQHFEASREVSGTDVTCPSCEVLFRAPKAPGQPVKLVILALLLCLNGLVIWHRVQESRAAAAEQEAFLDGINPERHLSQWQIEDRREKMAEQCLLKECSNYVGFVRVVDHWIYDNSSGVDPTNWHGTANIDYVNKVGGVERTNLIFCAFKTRHDVYMVIDSAAMWHREEEAEKRFREYQDQFSEK